MANARQRESWKTNTSIICTLRNRSNAPAQQANTPYPDDALMPELLHPEEDTIGKAQAQSSKFKTACMSGQDQHACHAMNGTGVNKDSALPQNVRGRSCEHCLGCGSPTLRGGSAAFIWMRDSGPVYTTTPYARPEFLSVHPRSRISLIVTGTFVTS